MKIGIIDSGRGGLAVGNRLRDVGNEFIFLLDKSFFPYGNRSKEFLIKRAIYLCKVLINYNVDLIVVACNTLSIYAYNFLKIYFKIRIYDVFSYFVPYLNPNNTIIATKGTIAFVKEHYSVKTIDGSDFINAIEEKEDLDKYVAKINNIKTNLLLLGCTHFLEVEAFKINTLNQIAMLKEDLLKK